MNHVRTRHQKIKDPWLICLLTWSEDGEVHGVPVGVFARIVDEATLVQYVAYLTPLRRSRYNSIPITLAGDDPHSFFLPVSYSLPVDGCC